MTLPHLFNLLSLNLHKCTKWRIHQHHRVVRLKMIMTLNIIYLKYLVLTSNINPSNKYTSQENLNVWDLLLNDENFECTTWSSKAKWFLTYNSRVWSIKFHCYKYIPFIHLHLLNYMNAFYFGIYIYKDITRF